jgi:hypothetical protein
MMDEMLDEGMNDSARRVAGALREEVPVRAAWRDDLLARIEADAPARRVRGFQLSAPLAIAAGLVILATGYAIGRGASRDVASPNAIAASDARSVIRFVYVAPGAGKVSVVGDFNAWNPTAIPLRRLGDGTWIADVPLTPGRYAYAFVVDGKIEVDPTAPRADDGDFGANSVLMVRGL